MELSTLLLPLVVGLLFLLLSVIVSYATNLLNCVLTLSFRVLRDLDQLLHFRTHRFVLVCDCILEAFHLFSDLVLYFVHLCFDIWGATLLGFILKVFLLIISHGHTKVFSLFIYWR